ncbi:MAG: inner-membrane translocator [Deltaproteobacteria bacterium]|nr:inner-membrane translocator [Deltaproteobacteria bacterium]MBI3293857.1 inner-membrane translocator [Deltaproteobacteria bacterium]
MSVSVSSPALPINLLRPAKDWARFVIPLAVILTFAILFHLLSEGIFFSPRNLSNLSRQVCVNLTLAVGMTLVILTSGIDLSVGSVLALSGMLAAITQVHGGLSHWGTFGAILSFLIALLVGSSAGGFTGYAVSRLKITPFIVSLGMMVICRGLTLIVSSAQAVAPIGDSLSSVSSDYLPVTASRICLTIVLAATIASFVYALYHRKFTVESLVAYIGALLFLSLSYFAFVGYRGIPYIAFIAALCAGAASLVLRYTRFGRFIYAVGSNREAAELSGVPVAKTLGLTYLIMGSLAGLAGVMDVARVNGAVPSAGELAELDAIAAVVIGGTSLMGGIGTIGGTLFGVLMMGVLNNGMSLIGINEHYQKVFKGIVIILAVYLDLRSKKK